MSKQLPEILETYYNATNAHDTSAMSACFAENAVVHDEGEELRGIEAVRSWIESTTQKYRATAEVTEVKRQGNEVDVTALVSGDFAGSPISLDYHFTLEGERISALSIG